MTDGIDVRELEQLDTDLLRLAQRTMPRETQKFLRDEGNKLRRNVHNLAQARVSVKTGNYLKGIVARVDGSKVRVKGKWKRGKPYLYVPDNAYAVRIYNNAPHAHLLEDGHDMVGHKPNKTKVGFVDGYDILADATTYYEPSFVAAASDFIADVLEGGLA